MDEEIHYIVEDAAEVVYENLGRLMQIKFPVADIIKILDLEFEYQKLVGVASEKKSISNYPVTLDTEEITAFVLRKCKDIGIVIREDELEEIFEKEFIYLEMIGLIDDEDGLPHLN
ncbi:hypothetical protein TH61_16230 [Rufibacter sp. DG15C]|uniref:hypothetical protein n=1 Tax=Rufibacter sp. DG15C TaxID=1379909 RepID=UPI00078C9C7D|nr:hypothetical protein [Rufibacter sp. DG15C]AMM52424.1 hypothetical protein TH61_16230 [Rufibacter sp. DG15C]